MRVQFWGVRGSVPAPVGSEEVAGRLVDALQRLGREAQPPALGNREEVARWVDKLPSAVRGHSGGNTPCVTMTTQGGDLFIVDLGTGVRVLGNRLMEGPFGRGQGKAHLFLSHFHWDHIQGWPFFKPAYVQGNVLEMYSVHQGLEKRLQQQQEAPFFPPAAWEDMRATISYHQIPGAGLTLCGGAVNVTYLELNHPSLAYAYRFEVDGKILVYASDGAYLDLDDVSLSPFAEFFADADLLIFDAQFTLSESFEKRTWGHSSAVIGVELAAKAKVKRLALFHHDPNSDDAMLEHMLQVGKEYASNPSAVFRRHAHELDIFLAREGEEVVL